jgi:hypothetical protein
MQNLLEDIEARESTYRKSFRSRKEFDEAT